MPTEREWRAIDAYFTHATPFAGGVTSRADVMAMLSLWANQKPAGTASDADIPDVWWAAAPARSAGDESARVGEAAASLAERRAAASVLGITDGAALLPAFERAQLAVYFSVLSIGASRKGGGGAQCSLEKEGWEGQGVGVPDGEGGPAHGWGDDFHLRRSSL
jgi:hypothetical protein